MVDVVIYTRVSTSEQAEKGFSLHDQKQKLENYCEKNHLNIVRHFEEDHSAKTFNRPQFTALLEFVRKHKKSIKKLI